MNKVELVGIVASIFIIISMSFNVSTLKSKILMRVTSLLGAITFTIYGFLLPAISTAFLNIVLIGVNTHYLIQLLKENKK